MRRLAIYKAGDSIPHKYAILSEVKGSVCMKKGTAQESEAFSKMKEKAMELHADAVINYACRAKTFSWCLDQGDQAECAGDAVKWTD